MWETGWRDGLWQQLRNPWDVVVVGGGITGAGVFRLATRLGWRALLVEARDFAWGTSSRSTKLVHGGLRYLAQGQFGVTRESVREREQLVAEGPGLVEWMGFLCPLYKGSGRGRGSFSLGLALYDLFARKWAHRYCERDELRALAPHLEGQGLLGGFRYYDAVTDDARLVLRLLGEAKAAGGEALNYAVAEELVLDDGGRACGIVVRDALSGRTTKVPARVVINATGAWSDSLRDQVGGPPRIRPSRGSHLVFPFWRLPLAQAITLVHPRDGRPVFVLPWEGVTLAGTTDLDHPEPLDVEPRASAEEVQYLMCALRSTFPRLDLGAKDVLCTFAGIRPIVGSGSGDPSKESRAHVVMEERGLVTAAGGKLTTFRTMAVDTLKAAARLMGARPQWEQGFRFLNTVPAGILGAPALAPDQQQRLLGRYGVTARLLVGAATEADLHTIEDTAYLRAELRWAAVHEAAVHLDDLFMRRVRLGLILPDGAVDLVRESRSWLQRDLGWDDSRWEAELETYFRVVREAYGVPEEEQPTPDPATC
jgi:glycerol-3-phosphate dehydrogenase